MRDRAPVLRVFLAIAVSVAGCAIVRSAAAQGVEDDAEAHFREGEAAFERQEYERALASFREAFRLAPHDAVRFNIAVCLERLGRIREAVTEYEAAALSAVLDRSARQHAAELGERARAELVTLVVEGSPEGAGVYIDQELRCSIPCRTPVDPGAREVIVRSGSREVRRSLDAAPGTLVILDVGALESSEEEAPGGAGPSEVGSGGMEADGQAGLSEEQERPAVSSATGFEPSAWTWIGGTIALVGVGGIIGFGVRARDLHSAYEASPTAAVRDEGLWMRDLANAAIAIAGAGAIVVLVDLVLAASRASEPRSLSIRGARLQLRF